MGLRASTSSSAPSITVPAAQLPDALLAKHLVAQCRHPGRLGFRFLTLAARDKVIDQHWMIALDNVLRYRATAPSAASLSFPADQCETRERGSQSGCRWYVRDEVMIALLGAKYDSTRAPGQIE